MWEIQVKFQIEDKDYIMLIDMGIFKIRWLCLSECSANSRFGIPILAKVETSTLKENLGYWLKGLKWNLFKQRRKKYSKS